MNKKVPKWIFFFSLFLLINAAKVFSQVNSTPNLRITSPNGGEKWEASSTQTITWQSSGIAQVKIEYSFSGGMGWHTVTSSIDASLGQYSWVVPNVQIAEVLIKISNASNTSVFDVSDRLFSIFIQTSSNKYKSKQMSVQSGTPLKIMPLGDSITEGEGDDPNYVGYRAELWHLLYTAGYNFTFVGNQASGTSSYSDGFNNHHEGHGGMEVGPPSYNSYTTMLDNIDTYLSTLQSSSNTPDIVLFHMGTNDIDNTPTQESTIASQLYEVCTNHILDATVGNPNAEIFLAKIIANYFSYPTYFNATTTLNTDIVNDYNNTSILPSAQKKNIQLVDMQSSPELVYPDDFSSSGGGYAVLHPLPSGYVKMAQHWFNVMQAYYQPALVGPADAATDQAINVSLSWNKPQAVTDNNALTYQLQISTTSDFASPVYDNSSISSSVTSVSAPNLNYSTQYYWRVRITNYGWSDIWNFTTMPGAHSIDSVYATSIATNSATINSEVNTGNQSTIVRFQWDINNDAAWPNNQPASNSPLSSDGAGTLNISGLSPNTIYYFRSYISNGSGSDTSIIKSFTTLPDAPSIDSIYATSIAANSATLNSEMNTGNQSTTINFQWDINNDAIWPNNQAASNSPRTSDGNATLNITGLIPNTTYYFRSFVSNPNGSDTSTVKSFTTIPGAPSIDSIYATSIAANSATLNSEMNTGNQSTIINFQWDINNDAAWPNNQPASNSPLSSDGAGTLNISGLSPNTIYYFRSYISNGSGSDTSAIKSFTTLPYAAVKAKLFLQGPYGGGDTMHTSLSQNNLIPTSQPYGGSPWNYSGSEHVSNIPANTIDWVLVQLRSDTSTIVGTRAALLKSDGSVVDTDGTSPLKFNGIAGGNYYIVIEHRNHLAVMDKNKVTLPNVIAYDFTTAQTQAYGSNPMSALGDGKFGMISGDGNGNGQIQNNDSENIWKPDNGTAGYKNSDFNLNGQVQNNDNESYWKPNNGRGTHVPLPN